MLPNCISKVLGIKSLLLCAIVFFYIADSSGGCLNNCRSCIDFKKCIICDDGYFLSVHQTCVECPYECSKCKWDSQRSKVKCSDCKEQYTMFDGYCAKCNPGCGIGCLTEPDQCIDCKPSFEMIAENKRCVPVGEGGESDGCETLKDEKCEKCEIGHFKLYFKCYECKYPGIVCNFSKESEYTIHKKKIQEIVTNFNQKVSKNNQFTLPEEASENIVIFYYYVQKLRDEGISDTDIYQQLSKKPEIFDDLSNLVVEAQGLYTALTKNSGDVKQWPSDDVVDYAYEGLLLDLCIAGYGVKEEKCEKCSQTNCLRCEEGQCIICQYSYYLDKGECLLCSNSIENCEACEKQQQTGQLVCTQCLFAHFPNQNICSMCQLPCISCYKDKCVTCVHPYSFQANSQGKCFRCAQDICATCVQSQPEICLQCLPRFHLDDGECKRCSDGCYTCSSKDYCVECLFGYHMNDENQCVDGTHCNKGCWECSESDKSICHECQYGYYLNQHYRCILCQHEYCWVYKEGICLFLEFGMTIYKDKPTSCHPGCKHCDMNNPQICIECFEEYWLNGITCQRCGLNCQVCYDSNSCERCYLYAHDLKNGSCGYCEGNCKECSGETCLSCYRGYKFNQEGQCVDPCKPGCVFCDYNKPQICHYCSHGMALLHDGSCARCSSTCIGVCDANNTNTCIYQGYGYNILSQNLQKCPLGCQRCQDNTCTRCERGYEFYDRNLKQHELCGWVDQPREDYIQCFKICPHECKKCIHGDCFDCIEGFKMNNDGSCVIDDSSSYKTNGYCQIGSYENDVQQCVACSQNCLTCSSQKCYHCYDGFYESKGVCVNCPQGCTVCHNQIICQQCKPSFYLFAIHFYVFENVEFGYCKKCADQCETCRYYSDWCLTCKSKHKKHGTTCIPEKIVQFTLKFDVDYEKFGHQGGIKKVTGPIAKKLNLPENQIYIIEVVEGSTKVVGEIPQEQTEQVLKYKRQIQNIQFEYPLIERSVSAIDGEITINDPCDTCQCKKDCPDQCICIDPCETCQCNKDCPAQCDCPDLCKNCDCKNKPEDCHESCNCPQPDQCENCDCKNKPEDCHESCNCPQPDQCEKCDCDQNPGACPSSCCSVLCSQSNCEGECQEGKCVQKKEETPVGLIVGISVGVLVLVGIIVALLFICAKKKKNLQTKVPSVSETPNASMKSSQSELANGM